MAFRIPLLCLLCLLAVYAPRPTSGARVLFLGALGTRSHKNSFTPIIEELGRRGHTVVSVTHTKNKKEVANVTEVVIEEIPGLLKELMPSDMISRKKKDEAQTMLIIEVLKRFQTEGCDFILGNKYIQDLVAGREPAPDILISSMFANDCNMGIAHRLNVPIVHFSPAGVVPWTISNLRIPNDPTYCPSLVGGTSDRIPFFGRLGNALQVLIFSLVRNYYWTPSLHEVMKKHLGEDIPSPLETEKNYSLVLLNNHFSFDFPKPQTPNLISVGGSHVRKAKPLPKDLEEWMSGSGEAGVVYFSLGSAVPTSSMPEEYRQLFIDAFSRIPQRVIWKWEKDDMTGLPPNVKISKWLPQQDILGHPKIRAFITHGGLLSTMETTFHGVPVVGIPIGGDQGMNMRKTEAEGAGIRLSWETITADSLVEALNEVMNNPIFRHHVSRRSFIAQDMDMHPLDRGIYWIEYVIRHKGAYHLQQGSLYLNDFQYYMVDIYLFLHAVAVIAFIISFALCSCVYRRFCKSKQKTD